MKPKEVVRALLAAMGLLCALSLIVTFLDRNYGVYSLVSGMALLGLAIFYFVRYGESDFIPLDLSEDEMTARRDAYKRSKRKKENIGNSLILLALLMMGLEVAHIARPPIPFAFWGFLALGAMVWMATDRCPFCNALSTRQGRCLSCGQFI